MTTPNPHHPAQRTKGAPKGLPGGLSEGLPKGMPKANVPTTIPPSLDPSPDTSVEVVEDPRLGVARMPAVPSGDGGCSISPQKDQTCKNR